jgi:hypothetical protein
MAVILIHPTAHCQGQFVSSDKIFTGQKEREGPRFAASFPRVTMDFPDEVTAFQLKITND